VIRKPGGRQFRATNRVVFFPLSRGWQVFEFLFLGGGGDPTGCSIWPRENFRSGRFFLKKNRGGGGGGPTFDFSFFSARATLGGGLIFHLYSDAGERIFLLEPIWDRLNWGGTSLGGSNV